MKYLKTVILENFQSHKYSTIDFCEGLNVILGPSDSGKSAIIRGIKWALYNEPSGDYFIREGEREASVTLVFSDNTKLTRLRSKSKNAYILSKKNGEEIKFEGFGTSVPEEIIEEIGIKKIRLDSEASSSINIGEQLEGPFLLSEKNSTRAGAIGRLIGVNVIDDAQKETLRDIRNTSILRKEIEDRVIKLENELKEFEYLADLERILYKVEDLKEQIEKKAVRKEKAVECNNRYKELTQNLNSINSLLDRLSTVDAIDPLVETLDKAINSYKYLNIKVSHFNKNQEEISACLTVMGRLDDLDTADQLLNRSSNLFNKINSLLRSRNTLNATIEEEGLLKAIYNRLENLYEVERALISIEEKAAQISKLTKLRTDYHLNQRNISIGRDFIRQFDNIKKSEKMYLRINENMDKLYKLTNIYKKISQLKADYEKEDMELSKTNKDIKVKLDTYKDLLSKVEICPFCMSDIDNNKIEHIISHYNGRF